MSDRFSMNVAKKPKLIAIEGSDQVGKCTQTAMLVAHLRRIGYDTCSVEVPAQNMFKPTIYKMLKNGDAVKYPLLFQVVHILNRLYFQHFTFKKYSKYDCVVFDRWNVSSFAYGVASGVPRSVIRRLMSYLMPVDCTIILDASQKEVPRDVYESDGNFQAKVRELYREYASMHQSTSSLIHANGLKGDIHESIVHEVMTKFSEVLGLDSKGKQ